MADKAEQYKQQNQDEDKWEEREQDGKKQFLDPVTKEWVTKNEQKKRKTKRKKEAEAAAKGPKPSADKPAGQGKKPAADKKPAVDADESGANYNELRKKMLQDMRDKGQEVYPHKFHKDMTIPKFRAEYEAKEIKEGVFLEDKLVKLTGRIYSIRSQSAKLIFIDLQEDNAQVQIFATKAQYQDDFDVLSKVIRRGDIVGVEGNPGRTKTGELSIRPTKILPLSYCLHQLPTAKDGEDPFANTDTKYRQRYMDLIVNKQTKTVFETRNKIVDFIRRFLREREFIEVETPMMNMIPGGATARPFETHHNELNMKLYMRVAPELYLKMLVVGGMNKVFEIGKQFRNEGMDTTHNPEFTTCEFYWAYADYNDLMEMTEQMLSEMVLEITGSYKIMHTPENGDPYEIDFSPPFKRLPMMQSLSEYLKMDLPPNDQLDTDASRKFFDDLVKKQGLDCKPPRTTARLIDKLVGEYLEPQCKNPTYITDTPILMSPLAKWHRSEKGLSERFELFCNYHEIINAYTELNDPKVQLECFNKQAEAKNEGDLEAQYVDNNYVTALEYGLPPTAGWGCGVDRITMLLTNKISIKDVMLFPAMKPNEAIRVVGGDKLGGAQEKCEVFYNSIQDMIVPGMTAAFAGHNQVTFTKVDSKDAAALSLPYLKTGAGEIISTTSGIMSFLGRSNADAALYGKNMFEEAQVNQWLAWSECLAPVMGALTDMVFKKAAAEVDQKAFNQLVDSLKKEVAFLNNHLKGKQYIVGSQPTMADIACATLLTPAFQLVLDAGFRKGKVGADLAKWFTAFTNLKPVVDTAGKIKCCEKAFKFSAGGGGGAAQAAPKKEAKKEAKKKDDEVEMDDLFGDDDEADAEAAKKAQEAAKKGGKKKKKEVIAQSLVMYEVKPADSETDLDKLAQKVFKIQRDGIYWKTQYKKEPVAFGIFKLIIGVTVEDEKISVDGLQEEIEEFEEVQSVDILAFNKI